MRAAIIALLAAIPMPTRPLTLRLQDAGQQPVERDDACYPRQPDRATVHVRAPKRRNDVFTVRGLKLFVRPRSTIGSSGLCGTVPAPLRANDGGLPGCPSPPPPAVRFTNVALGRPTVQSSTLPGVVGEGPTYGAYAVDGNKVCVGGLPNNTWAGSGFDNPSWWVVDLGAFFQVANVTIYGRDCCTAQAGTAGNTIQSNHLEVRVGNSSNSGGPENLLCASEVSAPAAGVTVACAGITGRYVSVFKTGVDGAYADYMMLCEVEVYAAG